MDPATAWKKSHFILLDRSDFHVIDNMPVAFHSFVNGTAVKYCLCFHADNIYNDYHNIRQ